MSAAHSYRLSREVVPSHYTLTVEPDLDDGTFTGTVTIDATVERATSTIVCNSLDLSIGEARVTAGGDELSATVTTDETDERIALALDRELAPGPIQIAISFAGRFNEHLVGFYGSTFQVDGAEHRIGVTQFEAPHARRAFPCWDEPEFKATFDISVVCESSLLAVSNESEVARTPLDDGRTRYDFARTMPMSTYLVAWIVGGLEATSGDARSASGTPVRVIHRPGQEHLTSFALDCAVHALDWFEEYYGIAYPASKLDLVSVPDFAFGAMENLGCVTFRESLLLLDPARVSRPEIERAAAVICHEIAHMWFGDLVTMKWWNGIWLNEAFATFMELSCADAYRPEWDVWTSFGMSKAPAFDTDSLASTRPIEYEVTSPDDAEGMFDILTYEKGAAVLRMLEQWIGPDTFRDGVRLYLDRHRYGNTDTADLWAALGEATGQAVGDIMDTWILQGGHPVVSVTVDGSTVTLSQRRSSPLGADPAPEATWAVPVRVSAQIDGAMVTRNVLLDGERLEVDLGAEPSFVDANPDASGFFRTHYAGESADAHRLRLAAMQPVGRFALLDDTWASLLNGDTDLAHTTQVLRDIAANETDPSIWRRLSWAVGSLRLIGGPTNAEAVQRFARELAVKRLADVTAIVDGGGGGGTDDDRDLRSILFRLAGALGRDADVVATARRLLDQVIDEPTAVDGALTGAVLDVVAANGDAADFDRVLELFRAAPAPQDELRALGSLAAFDVPELATRLCAMSLDEIRSQNAPFTLAQAMGNPVTGAAYWAFVSEHWAEMTERFPSNSIVRMAGGVRSFYDDDLVAAVHRFFADHDIPQGRMSLLQHLERTRVNVALRHRVIDTFDDAMR